MFHPNIIISLLIDQLYKFTQPPFLHSDTRVKYILHNNDNNDHINDYLYHDHNHDHHNTCPNI